MTSYSPVGTREFLTFFAGARDASPMIAAATSAPEELPKDADYFLDFEGAAGYGIHNGDLISVFSLERGRGDELVESAILNGAVTLDCFDGYLPTFYAKHGFKEYKREANWTPGGPDVVYMSRAN